MKHSEHDARLDMTVRAARQAGCDDSDGLDGARGIIIALPIGIAIWVILFALVLWLTN